MNRTYTLKNGTEIVRLGQGTWYLGQNYSPRKQEIETLRRGIELGMNLIDTAEMYGGGRSEELVGEAIRGYDRESLYLVSKVYPHNAGKKHLEKSLDDSLRRMGVDYLDLYLLHWRGSIPFRETVAEMERMVAAGKIKSWGVSNLDVDDMDELLAQAKGSHCQVDQVLYHLGSRGVEYDLQPYLEERNMALMAYCPLAQSGTLKKGLFTDPAVLAAAKNHDATPAQVLLNFVLQKENVVAIPKASSIAHVEENAKALSFCLTADELAKINKSFPAPTRKMYLDIV